jgi:hypothetical protein
MACPRRPANVPASAQTLRTIADVLEAGSQREPRRQHGTLYEVSHDAVVVVSRVVVVVVVVVVAVINWWWW